MVIKPLPTPVTAAEITTDDLKRISGIGPAIERRLQEGGIRTFAQLAGLSPVEIAALVSDLAGMSEERIIHQDWIGQARTLTQQTSSELSPNPASAGSRQHYATFTIELLFDGENNIRRTRIMHIQAGAEDTWAGWAETRLVNFIAEHANLQLPPAGPISAAAAITETASVVAAGAEPPPAPTNLGGVLSLQALKTAPLDVAGSQHLLRGGQPFNIYLTLDLTEVAGPAHSPLNYAAVVYAKSLSGGYYQTVAEMQEAVNPGDKRTITLAGSSLASGIYRLEAVVTLALPSGPSQLMAHLEGGLLQVY